MKAKILTSIKGFGSLLLSKVPRKFLIGAVVIVAAVVGYYAFKAAVHVAWAVSGGEVEFVMEGRDRVVRDEGSSYEIYTSEGVFTNQDSLLRLKRNSGDLQNDLRPGRTYVCDTQGFRFRYFDLMQNLIGCTERKISDVVPQG